MFSNCLSVHGVPIEAERSQSSSKTLKDSLICILDDVLIQILLNIKETSLITVTILCKSHTSLTSFFAKSQIRGTTVLVLFT